MREMEEMIMMREENFTQGEYVKKEDVMTYLRVFDWNMPREKLIEKFEEMPAINLTDQDVNKVKIKKQIERTIKSMIEFGKGLDEEKIKMISSLKKEPDWML